MPYRYDMLQGPFWHHRSGRTDSCSDSRDNTVTASTNGHYYELNPLSLNWGSALASASSRTYLGMTGHVATIESLAEKDFVVSLTNSATWIGGMLVLSAYRDCDNIPGAARISYPSFYWFGGANAGLAITGSLPTFWDAAQPSQPGGNGNYVCMLMMQTSGLWMTQVPRSCPFLISQQCSATFQSVIEYEPFGGTYLASELFA